MYNIVLPNTIRQIFPVFYGLRMWNIADADGISIREKKGTLFHFLFYVSFVLSIATGACNTKKDEFVFLTALSVVASVHILRMLYILTKKREIIKLIDQLGTHSTNDIREFIQTSKKINKFVKFVKAFISLCILAVVLAVIYPVLSNGKTLINIAFPWKSNQFAFCVEHMFIALGSIYAMLCYLLSILVWFIMINGSVKYEMLGNKLKYMGVTNTKLSKSAKELLFLNDLVEAIKSHRKITVTINEFFSTFSMLFVIQVFTSSISICGSVFILAFNSHKNLAQDGIYFLMLLYNLFDISVVMYLGNEIKLKSGQISYSLFESNWIDQTHACKTYILILTEVLKKPQELIIGKLYPLDLRTLAKIVKGAYSMFNILQKSHL